MNGNVIRTITIRGTSEGLDKVTADINKLAAAEQNVAVVSEQSAKRVLSLEDAWKRQTLKLDEAARAQANMAREQKLAEQAMRQGIVTQQQYAERLDLINQKYGQATIAQRAFSTATSGVSAQLTAMAAGAGPVGVFLSALGPWGIAAAVGIGAVTTALNHMQAEAERVGQKAVEVKKFSDVSGLTAEQIRGLGKLGHEFGVSSDEMATGIERFTVNLNEARRGAGTLYEEIRRIDPALASELASATSAADGLDIYARALKRAQDAGDSVQRAALSRAGLGRGGLEAGRALADLADKGGLDAMAQKTREVSGITNEWVENVARLTRENEKLEKQIADMKANAYAQEVLERQNQYLKTQKLITEELLKLGTGGITRFFTQLAVSAESDPLAAAKARQPKVSPLAADLGAGDIAGSVAGSAKDAIDPLTQLKNALAETIANAGKAQSALGSYADTVDTLRTKQQALTAAFLDKTISAEQYTRANDAFQQQITYVDQLKAKYGGVTEETAKQLESLNQHIALAQTRNGAEQINLQYQQTIANAMGTQKPMAEAIAIAEAQRALSVAEANKQADITLKSLQQQGELLRASSDYEKESIKARQTYQDLIDKNVDSDKARAVANQQLANSGYERRAREDADATRDAADAAQQKAASNERAAAAAQREAQFAAEAARRYEQAYEAHKFLPFMLLDQMGSLNSGWTSKQGGQSQFNPAGYTSSTLPSLGFESIYRQLYGEGGFDPKSGAPTSQGMEFQFNKALTQAGGNMGAAVGNLLSGGVLTKGAIGAPPQLDTQKLGLITRGIDLLSKDQQIGATQGLIGQLSAAPASLQTSELIKQLNDKLEQLTTATDANTSATSAMTDVLSPFYSSDPRSTHLGFRAFAGGGIMTQYGELPLRQYQGGGIATSPQVAVFGEGSMPEAYVPAPAGRIPVEIKQPANSNQRPVSVTINVMGNADAGTVAALKTTAFQQAQAMRRVMR